MNRVRLTGMAIACGLVIFASAAPTNAALVPAFSLDGTGNSVGATDAVSLGYMFHTTQTLTIVALGTYDQGGTSITPRGGSIAVKLYDNGGSPGLLLAATTVLDTDPATSLSGGAYTTGDAFRYHSITPLVLPAGNYEIVAGTGTDNNIPFRYNAGNTPYTGVVLDHPVYLYGASQADYSPLTYDPNIPGDFAANFLVSVVPEPTSFTIAMFACSALAMIVRRRKI